MFFCLPEHKAEEIPQAQGWLELRITWQKCEMEFRLLNLKKKVSVPFCMNKQNIGWNLIISPKLEKVVEEGNFSFQTRYISLLK